MAEDSSPWWTKAQRYWQQINDEQRLERLEQCRQLEAILQDCRVNGGQSKLDDTPSGIRMLRYFNWREVESDATCQRELHAVWACRAIAVGCGEDLVRLRNCFDKATPAVILAGEPVYEQASKQVPCGELQQRMASCIQKSAMDLQQRVEARSSDR